MQHWPNKEQLHNYLYDIHKGEFGAYGDDLLEAFDDLEQYEVSEYLNAIIDTMSLFVDDPYYISASKIERNKVIYKNIQNRKYSVNCSYIERNKEYKQKKCSDSILRKLLVCISILLSVFY
jgi:hypothetical protein